MNIYEQYKVNVPEGKSGKWAVEKFTVKENDTWAIHYALYGRPVPPGTYTRLMNGGHDPIMSDTPAEISDHMGFIHKAHGRCLINGLGLGVVLKAIATKPEVTHIDIVEKEQDVIDLVFPTYQHLPNVTPYHDDAFSIKWAKGTHWDCIWHDIWNNICTDNLPEIARLKHKYSHYTKYQAAWVEDLLRYYRKMGR